jgi:membrane-bound lytic murein transglycosylase B
LGLSGPAIVLLASWAAQAHAQPDFSQCLARLERSARATGIDAQLVDRVFATVQPRQRVIDADRNQAEFVETFGEYLSRRVNDRRVRVGREMYDLHRAQLDALARRYGVPGQYVVAFWGLETDFGRVLGDVPVFDALSTLACEGRRGEYYSDEFVTALRVAETGGFDPRAMLGSWAGAMGHTQFMPSNYLRFGVDGNADGRVDLWGDTDDALASAANFLRSLDWVPELRWGREVLLPPSFDFALAGRDQRRPLREWSAAGLTDTRGAPLPSLDIPASVLVPSGADGPAFIVYDNFDVIMRWNRSESFALTVGHLADRIAGGAALSRPPPQGPRIPRAQIVALQELLAREGYEVGAADGVFGSQSRAALRALQSDRGWIADGYPSADVLERLGLN